MAVWMAAICLISSCTEANDPIPAQPLTMAFTFAQGSEGWRAGFADYPEAGKEIYELESGPTPLPNGLHNGVGSLKIAGTNHSDDLFMFWKKPVTGLAPNQRYRIKIEIELASQYPASAVGVGGGPGASVYLKAGATRTEPKPVIASDGYWRMNIDKSNQSQSGVDMQVLGHIGIPGNNFVYQMIERNNISQLFEFTTDATGTAWLIVGTDSGFESRTTLYYHRIRYTFTPRQ